MVVGEMVVGGRWIPADRESWNNRGKKHPHNFFLKKVINSNSSYCSLPENYVIHMPSLHWNVTSLCLNLKMRLTLFK